MLSGEGNENGEKTTIGLISKKQFCTCSTIFFTLLCRCFARLQRETAGNVLVTRFLEDMSYTRSRSLFFFTAAHLHHALVAASISHVVTAATKFSCCSSNKKMSSSFDCLLLLFFLSLALNPYRPFYR